jgi:hypothetical protein
MLRWILDEADGTLYATLAPGVRLSRQTLVKIALYLRDEYDGKARGYGEGDLTIDFYKDQLTIRVFEPLRFRPMGSATLKPGELFGELRRLNWRLPR